MDHLKFVIFSSITGKEEIRESVPQPRISFHSSSLKSVKISSRDGSIIAEESYTEPQLIFAVPGTGVHLKCTKETRHWYVIFPNSSKFRLSKNQNLIEFEYENDWISAPILTPVPAEIVSIWETELKNIEIAYHTPIPENRLCGQAGVMNILRHVVMVNQQTEVDEISPAAKLKMLIDGDENFTYNLNELSRKCDYSNDHLRVLFQKQYQTSPLAYRNHLRMSRAMVMITSTDLSVSEISDQLGFSHVQHFCNSFRKENNITPGEAIKRFRH